MAGLFPGFNPLSQQGNLNRVATHVVVTSFPSLSVTASFMGKAQAKLTLEGPFVDQIMTATGVVNSPVPFVQGSIVINLLRSQPLANNWLQQTQITGTIGTVVIYPDSTTFSPMELLNCSIESLDPGPYDGADPTVNVTIRGTFPINSSMWSALTGTLGTL